MPYLLIKTADMTAHLEIVSDSGESLAADTWDAGRQLAKDLLAHIDGLMKRAGCEWQEITGVGVFEGPGSFTSLRIGITTANTIAYAQNIPIVGVQDEQWQRAAIDRLQAGENDQQVMPFYGADPHITAPRK